jgi:O-antigen ligase
MILTTTLNSLSTTLKWRKHHIIFVFLALSTLIALSLNVDSAKDLSHLVRIIYIISFSFLILAPWARSESNFYEKISKLLIATIIPMSVLFTVQMFPTGEISEFIYQIYGDTKLRPFTSSSPRVYGSFFNANWAGVYLMACWISLISLSTYKIITLRYFFILASLLILMTIATGSRTAMVGICAGLLWFVTTWIVFYSKTGKLRAFSRFGFILFFIFLFIIIFIDDLVFFDRFRELLTADDISEINSLSNRIGHWEEGMIHFLESPLIGPGVHGIPHNSYITWLQAFGLFGFLLLILLLFVLSFRWYTIGKRFSVLYSSSVLIGFLIMALTAEFFFVTQILLLIAPIVFGIFFTPRPQLEPSDSAVASKATLNPDTV